MNTEKINLDIHKILTLLPHRYPILLVDRVLELEPHKSIKALKNVTINEPYFQGHFPTRPVMPGVLMLEALAQTAALLTFAEEPQRPARRRCIYFVGIDGARFKRVVEPGDQLILNVHVRAPHARHLEVQGARRSGWRGRRGSRADVHGAAHGQPRLKPAQMSGAACTRIGASDNATESRGEGA